MKPTQGCFVYHFFDKKLSMNTMLGNNIYSIIPDFADFLDKTNGTYLDYQEWFFDKVLRNHKPDLYDPSKAKNQVIIDTNKKSIHHNAETKFLQRMGGAYKHEFEESIVFIRQKGYVINPVQGIVINIKITNNLEMKCR